MKQVARTSFIFDRGFLRTCSEAVNYDASDEIKTRTQARRMYYLLPLDLLSQYDFH
jgi:hypothetical protein